VMATPFSQIVGAQAVENCLLGERYKRILDQSIKYIGGHYGEPPGPIDSALMDRINAMPEAKAILDWKPVNRYKPLEQLRQEVGQDLSDEEFLLQLLIPGVDAKKFAAKVKAAEEAKKIAKPKAPAKRVTGPEVSGAVMNFPMEFCVKVEGEEFCVTLIGVGRDEGTSIAPEISAGEALRAKAPSPGAVKPAMAGLVVAIKVKPGQAIKKGDSIATIEAMKMLRDVIAPHSGVVEEIFFEEGNMLESDDVLMVVEPNNE
jgi:biotin carboxyl carrier protein